MKKILIIDDDPDNLYIISACVKNAEVIAKSEVIPIDEVIGLSPDLVILDHWIAGSIGGDLCLEIKKHPQTSHVPVVIVSAVVDLPAVAKLSCANAYIEKPFNISDIEDAVKEFLTVTAE